MGCGRMSRSQRRQIIDAAGYRRHQAPILQRLHQQMTLIAAIDRLAIADLLLNPREKTLQNEAPKGGRAGTGSLEKEVRCMHVPGAKILFRLGQSELTAL